MRFKHFGSLERSSNCVIEAVKLNPNSVLGLIILEQNASGDEYNTNVEQDLDDGCYEGTLQDVYEQCKGMMQKYQLGALFTYNSAHPLDYMITTYSFRFDLIDMVKLVPDVHCVWVPRTERSGNPPLGVWQNINSDQAMQLFEKVAGFRLPSFLSDCFRNKQGEDL